MDIEKVFESFDNTEQEDISLLPVKEKLIDPNSNHISYFIKIILSHDLFFDKLKKYIGDNGIDISYTESKAIVYNKAYNRIKKVDLSTENLPEVLNSFEQRVFMRMLDKTIYHFEYLEEYEKCAFLFRLKKLLN